VYLALDTKGLNLAETISCHVHFSLLFTVTELFFTVWSELLTAFLKKLQRKISVVG